MEDSSNSVKEGCGMRFSPHKSKSKTNCCVHGCKSYAKRDPTVRFHSLPKLGESAEVTVHNALNKNEKIDRRTAWQIALKIDKNCSDHARVCSLHFSKEDYVFPDVPCSARKLKKSAVPSANLPGKKLGTKVDSKKLKKSRTKVEVYRSYEAILETKKQTKV